MPRLSIARLFEDNREKLKLAWASGRAGGTKDLDSELIKGSSKGLIGHLNFIHPNWIQVLGATEIEYLERLSAPARTETLTEIASRGSACFIAAAVEDVPRELPEVAEETQTALFQTPLPSVELMWMLRP